MAYTGALAIIIGYLLGAIPSAYITARLKGGTDIRQLGSGNVGSLNVYRQIGPLYGIAVLAADMAKGVLAVYVAIWLGLPLAWAAGAGFAAVIGHNWPVYIGFKGGKGGATTLGVLVPLIPVPFGIGFGIAVVIVVITSNIRLGVLGIGFMSLFAWLFHEPFVLVMYPLALFLFLIIVSVIGFWGDLRNVKDKRSLIIDREYHFWQTRKKKGNGN